MTQKPWHERVLVVEPDQGIRSAVNDVLEQEGYSVTLAASRRDALWGLRTGPRLPTAILLDCAMSDLSGAEFRQHQKQSRAWAEVPVIVLPADRDTAAEARAIGAVAALRKPLDREQLLTLLADVAATKSALAAPLARSA